MRTDYLNPQLYNKLYSCMTYENVLALRVSLETGLRIDDVLSLRASQIVRRTICGIAEKTDKPYRKAISADLAKRLAALTPNKGGYIFPHRLDPLRHRTRQAVWVNMKKAAALIGVKLNAAPHSARKTYAVEMFKDKGLERTQYMRFRICCVVLNIRHKILWIWTLSRKLSRKKSRKGLKKCLNYEKSGGIIVEARHKNAFCAELLTKNGIPFAILLFYYKIGISSTLF